MDQIFAISFSKKREQISVKTVLTSQLLIMLKNLGQEGLGSTLRKNFYSGVKYEKLLGYSRAVKVGNNLYVSATSGFKGDKIGNNAYTQAKNAMERIVSVLRTARFDIRDVVRTRIYLSRKASWEDVARVYRQYFGKSMPACTLIVCDFVDRRILVEIEVDAVKDD